MEDISLQHEGPELYCVIARSRQRACDSYDDSLWNGGGEGRRCR
jgi:hypothetical protein